MKRIDYCIFCEYGKYEIQADFDERKHLFCKLKNRITFASNTCEHWKPTQGGEDHKRTDN